MSVSKGQALPVSRSDGAATRLETPSVVSALQHIAPSVLGQRVRIILAYPYGSVARGQASTESDVDVGVVLAENVLPLEQLDLEMELELALADATGLPNVDVRVLNTAPLLLQGAVVTEGVLLYARDEAARIAYEASTRRRYFDFLPAAQMMANTFATALKRRLDASPTERGGEWPA